MDYLYATILGEKSNRLQYVTDNAVNDGAGGDIIDGMSTINYSYDKLGQLRSDASEGISSMDWRYGDKKLKRILRNDANSPQIEFVYNPFGQRVLKIEKPRTAGVLSGSGDWIYTYYTYDANGQVMAVYSFVGNIVTNQTVTVDEYNIYGSSREGQLKAEEVVWQNGLPVVSFNGIYQNTLGERNYEVTNHLGNVLAVVTDRNTVVDSTYAAVVMMTTDYYPFGMVMPRSCDTIAAQDCYDTIVSNQVLVSDQFNTEVSDWVSWGTTNTVEIDWDNGKMHVKSPDRYRSAVRHIETVKGETYTVDLDIDIGLLGSVSVGLYNTQTGLYTGLGPITGNGPYQYTFVADSTVSTFALSFPNEFVNLEFWVDNFKVTGSKMVTTCPEVYVIDDDFDVDQGDWVARNSPVSLTVSNGGLTVEADSRVDVGKQTDSTERVLPYIIDDSTSSLLSTSSSRLMFQDGTARLRFTAISTNTRIEIFAEALTPFTPRSFTLEDIAVYSYDTTFTTPQQIVCHGQWENSGFDKYRYAYNGMEQDNEVSGNGNSYTTEFRQYDPRLGRWKITDPLAQIQPSWSPYKAMLNSPILFTDVDGDTEWKVTITINKKTGRTTVQARKVSDKIAYGKRTEHKHYLTSSTYNMYHYYDYAMVTVKVYDPETNSWEIGEPQQSIFSGDEVRDSDWLVFSPPTYGDTKYGPEDPKDYNSKGGVYRKGGFYMEGGDGPVGQDFSDNVWGEVDQDLLDALGKTNKSKYYQSGSGSWREMKGAGAEKWVSWAKKNMEGGEKIGELIEESGKGLSKESNKSESLWKLTIYESEPGSSGSAQTKEFWFKTEQEILDNYENASKVPSESKNYVLFRKKKI